MNLFISAHIYIYIYIYNVVVVIVVSNQLMMFRQDDYDRMTTSSSVNEVGNSRWPPRLLPTARSSDYRIVSDPMPVASRCSHCSALASSRTAVLKTCPNSTHARDESSACAVSRAMAARCARYDNPHIRPSVRLSVRRKVILSVETAGVANAIANRGRLPARPTMLPPSCRRRPAFRARDSIFVHFILL